MRYQIKVIFSDHSNKRMVWKVSMRNCKWLLITCALLAIRLTYQGTTTEKPFSIPPSFPYCSLVPTAMTEIRLLVRTEKIENGPNFFRMIEKPIETIFRSPEPH